MTFGFRMLGVHFYKIIMSKNTSTRNFQDLFCKIHDWNFLKKCHAAVIHFELS